MNKLHSRQIPPHHRCASHTLNLVATKDSENAMSDPMYKKQLRSTFAKMRALWKKQERTSLIADTIHDELNIYILLYLTPLDGILRSKP